MSEVNLRALFSPGRTPELSAQQVFTDRVSELGAFDRAVAEHLAATSGDAVTDLSVPRRNVLVFYGTGGIGKTALSRRLEQRAAEADRPRPTLRIDFSDAEARDLEILLLQLRIAIGQCGPRWDAFDLVFMAHWEHHHPDQPLADVVGKRTRLARAARTVGLSDQIQVALADISSAMVSTALPAFAVHRTADRVIDRLRSAAAARRLKRDCPFFAPLVDAPIGNETLSYATSLLAWELANHLPPGSAPQPVVFLDTFEEATARPEWETTVQRLLFLLPNVLFVLTTRNRITWADQAPGGHLDYVGRDRWPGLAAGSVDEPRQHALAYLSPDDCESYLSSVLRDGSEPAIPPEIREKITTGSRGLPLYLDLAVSYFLSVRSGGRPMSTDDFGGPLPAVITRVMRDLPPDERSALRGASLFTYFDIGLAAATGGVPHAAAKRLCARSFVDSQPDTPLPHSLHAILREAVRSVDETTDDGWSSEEWRSAARRGIEAIRPRAEEAIDGRDWLLLSLLYVEASRTAELAGEAPEWLFDAGVALAEAGFWRSLVAAGVDDGEGSVLAAFVEGFRGIGERRLGELASAERRLSKAAEHESMSARQRAVFRLHEANAVRNAGRYEEAEQQYRALEVTAVGDRVRQSAVYQLADISMLRGEFTAALDATNRLNERTDDPSVQPALAAEIERLLGHIHRFNGSFATAARHYSRAMDIGRTANLAGAEAKAAVNLAETAMWTRQADVDEVLARAEDLNDRTGNRLDAFKLSAARCVLSSNPETISSEILVSRELVQSSGYRAGLAFVLHAAVYGFVLAGDRHAADGSESELRSLTDELGVYRFLPAIAALWLGPDRADLGDFGWLDRDAATEAWLGVMPSARR